MCGDAYRCNSEHTHAKSCKTSCFFLFRCVIVFSSLGLLGRFMALQIDLFFIPVYYSCSVCSMFFDSSCHAAGQ